MDGRLTKLSAHIESLLQQRSQSDPILECGEAVLSLLVQRPDDVLALAHSKLHTWPYAQVPVCWRRLFEDASLAKAACRINEGVPLALGNRSTVKRARLDLVAECSSDLLTKLVEILDRGVIMSGTPLRSEVFADVFEQLNREFCPATEAYISQFPIIEPAPLESLYAIPRASHELSFEEFQNHLDTRGSPLIIPDSISDWPARLKWCQPDYLLQMTLGGRRLVPVELGRTYTDQDWGQKFMSFREFLCTHILAESVPDRAGYLAQHDLFSQIPQLRNDVRTPDYCYTAPPFKTSLTLDATGLRPAEPLDEPLMNAWFGPKGTMTPLHTDPYHNILCQVVGYKYIRLYAPQETNKLYPRGVDEKGVNMENTSQVDVSWCSYASRHADTRNSSSAQDEDSEFPLFVKAKYQEAVLGPGDALYIPLGWWHYIESLSTSFSVSFWWN